MTLRAIAATSGLRRSSLERIGAAPSFPEGFRFSGKILPPARSSCPRLRRRAGRGILARMDRDALVEYCRAKPYATSDFPFDELTLVVPVGGKMFALFALDADPPTANLKCDPEAAGDLRAAYPAITPGWHMNKEHWNTARLDRSLPGELVRLLADRSYELVLDGLSAREREKAGLPPKPPRARRASKAPVRSGARSPAERCGGFPCPKA